MKQLSALGGYSSGDTIRRMLKTLGTNALWSKYSLKGKKGKIAVQPLPVCGVMISKLNLKSINMRKEKKHYIYYTVDA